MNTRRNLSALQTYVYLSAYSDAEQDLKYWLKNRRLQNNALFPFTDGETEQVYQILDRNCPGKMHYSIPQVPLLSKLPINGWRVLAHEIMQYRSPVA